MSVSLPLSEWLSLTHATITDARRTCPRARPRALVAGHNGCYFCLREVQKCKPECPLCRQAFPVDYPLHPNPVLKQLVTTAQFQCGGVDEDGWESVPTRAHAVMMHAQDLEALQSTAPARLPSGPELDEPRPTHEVVRDAAAQHMSPTQHPLAILTGSYRNSAEPRHSYESILSWVPPQWMPDSCASECKACCLPFKPIVRLRHHCRLCGLIFCHTCSSKRVLLPPKYAILAVQFDRSTTQPVFAQTEVYMQINWRAVALYCICDPDYM